MLPQVTRDAVLKYHLEGYTVREIERIVGIHKRRIEALLRKNKLERNKDRIFNCNFILKKEKKKLIKSEKKYNSFKYSTYFRRKDGEIEV